MSTKQTPEHKRALALCDSLQRKALSDWSFKRLKTYEDLLVAGFGQNKESFQPYYSDAQLRGSVSYQQILDFYRTIRERVDSQFTNGHKTKEAIAHEYENIQFNPSALAIVPSPSENISESPLEKYLPESPKQKCFLFPFQERAAVKLLDGILIHHKRGQLLRAAVGTGKTYIIGAVARRLLDMEYCVGKTFSPWAMCWITRASIVEQSRRVLERDFGIDTVNELQVINIEQLRSSFGELMVRPETVVEDGYEHITWRWRPNVHPIIFFIDESQFAKNEQSQQSKLIQSIATIDNPHVYCIFFSATPLLRVCDAKYLVLNMRLSTKPNNMIDIAA